MAQTVITITHNETTNQMKGLLSADTSAKHRFGIQLQSYLNSLISGARNASLDVQIGNGVGVKASGTVTFAGAPVANDTVTVNGVVFTAVASGATGNQFNIGGTVAITATNLAAAINASVTAGVAGVVTAASALGVVTISAFKTGVMGNSLTLAKVASNTTVSGATLTGGVNEVANVFHFGL